MKIEPSRLRVTIRSLLNQSVLHSPSNEKTVRLKTRLHLVSR
ncbi:hypothetical protein RISK_004570 [Rhodopirellula islandica]|uniref:Uncharacterized protein n=1 Tax=Rhodopirellula islandica TaxID=595434 RepID=A0A0J1B9N8_RHOIS|nr:hypothetical protein RISK_004570 [Rhodopirellula islandica]